MQIDTLSQINEVINSLVKKGNFKQANNLNKLFLRMAQQPPAPGDTPVSPTDSNPPTAPTTPPKSPGGNSANQGNDVDAEMLNVIKQFDVLRKWAKLNNKFYAYSRGQFFTVDNEGKRVSAKTVGELLAPLGVDKVEIKELAGEAQQLANTIIQEIKSANSWSGVDQEASKAINAKYDLGYNFEQSKYYIGDPNSEDDVIFRDKVSDLETIYNALGQYYKENEKKLPGRLTEVESGMSAGAKQPDTSGPGGNAPGGNSATPGQPGRGPTNPADVASAADINSAIIA